MRIVSQDGRFDFPYEAVAVCISNLDKREIIVFSPHPDSGYMNTMAKYSTEEKARKAMEMLRETYLSYMKLEGGQSFMSNNYIQPNFWVLPKVFQFPKDEDVEA
jgi:hypothetical protein